jgi:hypothetical protein
VSHTTMWEHSGIRVVPHHFEVLQWQLVSLCVGLSSWNNETCSKAEQEPSIVEAATVAGTQCIYCPQSYTPRSTLSITMLQGVKAAGRLAAKSPNDVVVLSAVRSPITRSFRGGFKDAWPEDILGPVLDILPQCTKTVSV